ncbi:hypothetical protein [Sinorhizobium mexicanum]|uniref:Uncharacterized protein n=1 Tax=Sinorhizobium mexicanum TaxID=375549 RepID=A0A859QK33_9HYPH|nr:hypothetical protein [Sinorhizobium mexicanum]MBP1881953.1 hypothetical protein [Sinorhizobium mexicanum]QLL61687.1 hypothetical protein FKV68_09625 [Sinorhizobium mexicanum]
MTETAELFNRRAAYFAEQGFSGGDVFDKLAADPALPLMLTIYDIAAIEGIGPDAIRARRRRGKGPSWYREGNVLRTYATRVLPLSSRPICEAWPGDRRRVK